MIPDYIHNICQKAGRAARRMTLILLMGMAMPTLQARDDGKFVVVIDAGHGGHDTGACDNGAEEKEINLGVAQKLQKLIKKHLKDTKVVMTRDDDTFVSLQKRADIANSSKGDLFISIHTNSVDKKSRNRATVAGASVYALGLHKDGNNMAVAQRENSVIELEPNYKQTYKGFDPGRDESYIIFEMAQKKNLSQSIRFAGDVQKNLVSEAGRKDRGVHQAGFWVLWATSMPSVLIELDFICNPTEAAFISSAKGQERLAQAIFNAVRNYEAQASEEDRRVRASAVIPESASPAPRAHKSTPSATTAVRRRRSHASAQASARRSIETATINVLSEQDRMAVEEKQVAVAAAEKQPTVRSEAKKGRKRKEHRTKACKMQPVYKIQVLASDEKLKENNQRFLGLKPISMFKEHNLYKYTFGESTDRTEIESLLKEVKVKFPDAFIIKRIFN